MITHSLTQKFLSDGYVTIQNFFTEEEFFKIYKFAENWINQNISNAQDKQKNNIYLSLDRFNKYHEFIDKNGIDHSKIASSKYRYTLPPSDIISIIQKKKLFEYLESFTGTSKYIRWQDPGFGWLGYRLIRASSQDGYPPSCKNWGAASEVYSVWLPLAGCTEFSNIRFLSGSHKKSYKKYLPQDSKFTKGEYRLDEEISEEKFIRPIANPRDIVIYHPATIHSEDSKDENNTRLNLEYRFRPNHES